MGISKQQAARKFNAMIYDRAGEVDPHTQHDWVDLTYGFFLALGAKPSEALDWAMEAASGALMDDSEEDKEVAPSNEAERLLRKYEFCGEPCPHPTCPACFGNTKLGHLDDCEWEAAIVGGSDGR